MTAEEQINKCEKCEFHKIIKCTSGINIMACNHGDYKNHPVWGDFKCPIEEVRE